jgi:hypothetical protein
MSGASRLLCTLVYLVAASAAFAQTPLYPDAGALSLTKAAWQRPSALKYSGSSTATGTSRAFNPAISVNGLFLGFYTSEPFAREPAFGETHEHESGHDTEEPEVHEHEEEEGGHAHAHGLPGETGMSVQEVEVRFSAFIDAYLKGDLTLAIPGTEGLEVEEVVLTTVGLPNVTLTAGKLYAQFGKHNALHTHAFPFLDPPIANERVLGGEGLNEVGFGASFLLPSAWYSEISAQVLDGKNPLFASAEGRDFVYAGRWRNLWDLNDATTGELGGSYAGGKNSHGELTQLLGCDLTVKWRPLRRARDRAFIFQAEYLRARVNNEHDLGKAGGLYALMQTQIASRWWLQARYDRFSISDLEDEKEHRVSGLLAFVPTEFTTVRLQYGLNRTHTEDIHQIAIQLNYTMGSHPAHEY